MIESFDYHTFLSPFTWRYGSSEMRHIWSQAYQRITWRRIWVALAEAQMLAGLVRPEQVEDLRAHQNDVDIPAAHALEAELQHDLMAEVHVFARQCLVGGGIIHLGATSMDIEDNADVLRLRESLDLLIKKLARLLSSFADLIEVEADRVCIAFTHLQPAEPTTLGYRLAFSAQDLLEDYLALLQVRASLRGKGFKGAVGTGASYAELLRDTGLSPQGMEDQIMQRLGLSAFAVVHQTYPRRQDWNVLNALAGLAMTAYKFAFDLRLLQSPPIGELGEPFGQRQIGSSAMPFKRNPIHSENIDSLARFVAALPRIAWDNSAHSLLERTLDDSANRRVLLPESLLATDEILTRLLRLLNGLRVDEHAIRRNLETYGIFAATERLLMEAVRRGGDRQEWHEWIREHSMRAWEALRLGAANPLRKLLLEDPRVQEVFTQPEAEALLNAEHYVGDAPARSRALVARIRERLSEDS